MRAEKASLLGALSGLAHACDGNEPPTPEAVRTLIQGTLVSANPNANTDGLTLMTQWVHKAKDELRPGCKTCASPCGRTADYDLARLDEDGETVRKGKFLLLAAAQSIAAWLENNRDKELEELLITAWFLFGEAPDEEYLQIVLNRLGEALEKINQ